jgi:N-terminal domain of (some) glycogen debranching enzymes
MADRPLSIDIRHPLLLKANDLVLLTREDGEIVHDVPGYGLFYRDTCYLAAYGLRLHGTEPLLLMSSDEQGYAAGIALANRGFPREHAKSWGASKFLNAKLRAFGKETALWRSWFGG